MLTICPECYIFEFHIRDFCQFCMPSHAMLMSNYFNPRLVYRPGVEFSLQSCRQRFQSMNLVPASSTDQWQSIRVSAYLDQHSENMVRAAGALLKYLDTNCVSSGLDMDTTEGIEKCKKIAYNFLLILILQCKHQTFP